MPIRITSKRDGFRRCGIAHTGTEVYPDDRFTPAELAALQAESLLVVDILREPAPGKASK